MEVGMTIKSMACPAYPDLPDSTADLFGPEVKRIESGRTGTGLGWGLPSQPVNIDNI
jgi:hypothetical protein